MDMTTFITHIIYQCECFQLAIFLLTSLKFNFFICLSVLNAIFEFDLSQYNIRTHTVKLSLFE